MSIQSAVVKTLAVSFPAFLVLCAFAPAAHSWGPATHAYIASQIGNAKDLDGIDQTYGAMAPDLFSIIYKDRELQKRLAARTHTEFMKLWTSVPPGMSMDSAYGFVTHNELWGADYTADQSGQNSGKSVGYVTEKAAELRPFVLEILNRIYSGTAPEGVLETAATEFSECLVEAAVDIEMRTLDPEIGSRIAAAASLRSSDFPVLFIRVYGREIARDAGLTYLEAGKLIYFSERDFREKMFAYGKALSEKDDEKMLDAVSDMLALEAGAILDTYGASPPPGTDLATYTKDALREAATLCLDDCAAEIAATIHFVEHNMLENGIVR